MARNIQSQSGRSDAGIKSFVGLLANAIFWLVMAIVLPIRAFVDMVPALAPYAPWAPLVFYGLAVLSFVRAVRSLQRTAAGRRFASAKGRPSGGSTRPADQRGVKATIADHGLPTIDRRPTVQRMR
jgi:hypothetical protein